MFDCLFVSLFVCFFVVQSQISYQCLLVITKRTFSYSLYFFFFFQFVMVTLNNILQQEQTTVQRVHQHVNAYLNFLFTSGDLLDFRRRPVALLFGLRGFQLGVKSSCHSILAPSKTSDTERLVKKKTKKNALPVRGNDHLPNPGGLTLFLQNTNHECANLSFVVLVVYICTLTGGHNCFKAF